MKGGRCENCTQPGCPGLGREGARARAAREAFKWQQLIASVLGLQRRYVKKHREGRKSQEAVAFRNSIFIFKG